MAIFLTGRRRVDFTEDISVPFTVGQDELLTLTKLE
jgi:hypothetical protein